MKSFVIYSSQTGNTKKLAQAVYDNLQGDKEMHPVDQAPAVQAGDLAAVGFWLMAGKPDPKAAECIASLPPGVRLFLFATHGAAADSDHARAAMDHAKGLAPEADIAGVFSCQGEVAPKVLEKVGAKPEPPPWLKDAPHAKGHPDAADLDLLAEMVRSL